MVLGFTWYMVLHGTWFCTFPPQTACHVKQFQAALLLYRRAGKGRDCPVSDSERKVARRFFCRFGAGLGFALVRALSLHACARGGRAKLSVDASWFLGGGCAVFKHGVRPLLVQIPPHRGVPVLWPLAHRGVRFRAHPARCGRQRPDALAGCAWRRTPRCARAQGLHRQAPTPRRTRSASSGC